MRSARFGRTLVFTATLLLAQSGRLSAEDWPQIRGPNCAGVSTSKKELPAEFSATN